jgi:predicted metal-binding protein
VIALMPFRARRWPRYCFTTTQLRLAGEEKAEEMKLAESHEKLLERATLGGASDAVLISPRDILINDELAERCVLPRCENYGLSAGCPPHTTGPEGLRKFLTNCQRALFFRLDVPAEVLYSSDNRELFQLLHEVAAGVEREAVRLGFAQAAAFAGGSCRQLFCYEKRECRALLAGGRCRFPEVARPSMSGFGIDVGHLLRLAGWANRLGKLGGDGQEQGTTSVCGLVLLG